MSQDIFSTLALLVQIKAFLLKEVNRFDVDLFPEKPQNYRLNAEDGAILIQYMGSKFKPNSSTSIVCQEREIYVVLTILARSNMDEHGAVQVLDEVRRVMTGFKPAHCVSFELGEDHFEGQFDGLWQYQLEAKARTLQVQHHLINQERF